MRDIVNYEFQQYEILIQDQNSILGETFQQVFPLFMEISITEDKQIGKLHADDSVQVGKGLFIES